MIGKYASEKSKFPLAPCTSSSYAICYKLLLKTDSRSREIIKWYYRLFMSALLNTT